MKSFNQYISEYKRYDNGRIIPVAQGLNLVGIDPKTGEEVLIMRGSKLDKKKMEKFAKQHNIELAEGGKHKDTHKARAVAKVEAEWIKKKEKLDDEIDDIEDKIEKLKSRGPSDEVKKAKSVVDRLRKLKDAATKRKLDAQKKIDIATAKIEALRKKLK
jgi:Xaa-Pro aminopeptidase